jgi:hypothetical protein
MGDDRWLRERIRLTLDGARSRIRRYTGLYPDEDLSREVLHICDAVAAGADTSLRLREARGVVEMRCRRLAQVTNRFAERELASIARARAQAVAAVDMLQDAVLDHRRRKDPVQGNGIVLRRRSR